MDYTENGELISKKRLDCPVRSQCSRDEVEVRSEEPTKGFFASVLSLLRLRVEKLNR